VIVEVQLCDKVGVTHVQVDRSRVQGRERGLRSFRPNDVSRFLFYDSVLLSGGRAKAIFPAGKSVSVDTSPQRFVARDRRSRPGRERSQVQARRTVIFACERALVGGGGRCRYG